MANYNVPWNKGKGASDEVKKARKVAYYQKNKDKYIDKASARYKAKTADSKEYNRWYALYKKYGITKDAWFAMYDKQNGCCGICKKPATSLTKSLHVDHCHKTNKVRKLLCNGCNILMGIVDNEELLATGLEYKREFE